MISTFLAELEPLSYPDRMAALARRPPGPADLRQLGAGPSYQRFLAVTATMITGGDVSPFRHDPDASIRAVAVKHLLRTGRLAGADLVTLVADAPAVQRRLIYRTLRTARLTTAADGLIDAVLDRYGDVEAARVLPACGPDTVRRLLPRLDHAVTLPVLARRHGDLLLDHVESLLAATGGEEPTWARFGPAVLGTGELRVLDLLERHAPADSLPGPLRAYGRLAARSPARVAALLSAPARAVWLSRVTVPAGVLSRLAGLADDELIPLVRRLRNPATLLAQLPPARRGAVCSDVRVTDPVLEVLPHEWRVREAERMLQLDWVRDNPALTQWWTGYLRWDQARPVLEAATRSSSGDTRWTAYAALVGAARRSRDPGAVAIAVETLRRLRNEPDPVRAHALDALAGAAPLLTAGSAETLTRIAADALEARDASAATVTALNVLAVRLLRDHIDEPALRDVAVRILGLLSENGDLPSLGRLDSAAVFEPLRGWIENSMDRGRYEPLFAVTRALGRRAWRIPDLQALLARAIGPAHPSGVVRSAAERWLDDPAQRSARVERVLAADSSTVTLPIVWATLCARRTDLLDTVLTGPGPAGRLLDEGVRWVPGRPWHAERWLPRQREAFVRLQATVADDTGAELRIRAAALHHAARAGGRELVLRYTGSADVRLAEAALGALAHTEDAMSVLLEYADTERARVAMYAAGRAARFTAPSRLPALLGGILFAPGKVTSRKEAARLLAAYGPPQAMRSLLDAYRQQDQHGDVRAAIVAAARDRLYTPESWEILALAVAGRREEQLAVLAAVAARLTDRDRRRYATLVAQLCRGTDRQVVNAAYRRLPQWLGYLDEITDLVVDRFTDLTAGQLSGLVLATLQQHGAEAVETALRRLVDLDARDTDPDHDRPARRRVFHVAAGVQRWAHRAPATARAAALPAARWLAGHPAFQAAATGMLAELVEVRMPELAELVVPRPVLAVRTAERLGARVEREQASLDPGILVAAAESLRARGDLAGGLLALAVARAGESYQWSPVWQDLVRGLRRHPDPDVRDEAWAITMTRA